MGIRKKAQTVQQEMEPEVIYEQAKALASRDTIDALTRAVELLAALSDRKNANQLAESCLRRIMVLEARAREKRHKVIRMALVFSIAIGFSLYIILVIVKPSLNYRVGPSFTQSGNQEGGSLQTIKNNSGEGGEGEENSIKNTSSSGSSYDSLIAMSDGTVESYNGRTGVDANHGEVPDDWAPPASTGQSNTILGIVTGEGGLKGGSGLNESGSGSGDFSEENSSADTGPEDSGSTASMTLEDSGLQTSEKASGAESSGQTENVGQTESAGAKGSGTLETGALQQASGVENSLTEKSGTRNTSSAHLGKGAYLSACGILLAVILGLRLRKVIRAELQYHRAVTMIRSGQYSGAISLLKSLEGYRDSATKITGCRTAIRDESYTAAVRLKDSGKLEEAITAFNKLEGYKDSSDQVEGCRQSLQDREYDAAVALLKDDAYDDAIAAFTALKGYRDSGRMIEKCKRQAQMKPVYDRAAELEFDGKPAEAAKLYATVPGFKDTDEKLRAIKQSFYDEAKNIMDNGDFDAAASAFDGLDGFSDSKAMAELCRQTISGRGYEKALALKAAGRYEDAIDALKKLTGHPEAKSQIEICRKLVKIPRPFNGLDHGMTMDAVVAAFGAASDTKDAADGKTELVYRGRSFQGCSGHVSVTMAAGIVESVGWTADLTGGAGGTGSSAVNADKLYSSIIKYYTGLFGKQASDRQSPGHKVVWWLSPAITVDYSKDRYIHIMM